MANVLLVDDEPSVRESFGHYLRDRGHEVHVASCVETAMETLAAQSVDVVVSDIVLGGPSGLELLERIGKSSAIPVILLTGMPSVQTASDAVRGGAYDYLIKPVKPQRMDEAVRRAAQYARLERLVADRTARLELANQELDAYATAVSHDLRAPLRRIGSFTRLLETHQGDALDEQGRHYLDRIVANVGEMTRLIEALLSLSRVHRIEPKRTRVDLSEMCRAISAQLAERYGRSVDMCVADGLVADADPALLNTIMENLLGNGWKYTAHEQQPRIEVGRLEDEQQPAFFVRDNGVGFDMRYAERLFQPFQRLHGLGEFAGTGIGLHTAQRLVRLHGGRIWAEGKPGVGATFFFVL